MFRNNRDLITILYKIFIIVLALAQIYCLVFQVVNAFTLTINVLLLIYLIFRFYLIQKLSKEADKLNIPLAEFLEQRNVKCELCDECEKNCRG